MSNWKEVAFSNLANTCMAPRWILFKLNFDGSAHGNLGRATLDGLVRDSNGHILFSYSGPADLCIVNKAELLAPLTGFREASRCNLLGLRLEGDSSCTIRWTSGKANPPWQLVDTFEEVKDLFLRLRASFNHNNRSANGEADRLAKEGIGKPDLIFQFLPCLLDFLVFFRSCIGAVFCMTQLVFVAESFLVQYSALILYSVRDSSLFEWI